MEGLMWEPSIEQPTTMPECMKCGSSVEKSDNFCSNCGNPQTEAAQNRLDKMIKTKAKQQAGSSGSASGRDELISRVGYALGFVFVLSGLSVLPSVAGVFFLLGGILLFPPIRLLTARVFGSPLKFEAIAVLAGVLVLLGTLLFFLL